HLTRERKVVEVLVDRDFDRERQRVAAPRQRTLRPRRRLHAAAAATNVLLLLHRQESIRDLDHVDHLGRLELTFHRRQLAAARGAGLVRLVELERGLLLRQARLRGVAELRARLALLRTRLSLGLRLRFLGRERLACDLVQQPDRLLKLALAALERLELLALTGENAKQLVDLHLLSEGNAAQLLDVVLASRIHDTNKIMQRDPSQAESARSPPERAHDGRRARSLR